jgi:hypothetical protein
MLGARLVRITHHALIVCLLVGSMAVLSAQTVLDPRYVEFTPSADHNTLASDGTPLVSRYSLSFYAQGSSTAFTTVDLGKPAPGSGGLIRVDYMPLLTVQLTAGITFEARVAAVGPGGSNASTVSNAFAYSLPCAPAISPTSRSISQSAATGTVTVTATAGCAWTAVSSASWISISSGSSGSGNGTVSYSVAANTVAAERIGTITIAGQTFTITQAAAGCTFSLTPTGRTAAAGGESNTASVTTATGCSWTAASGASWIAIAGGASGSGSGTVSYNVAPNSAGTQRTGTLSIAGQTFTVTQSGVGCSYSISPVSGSVAASGGSGTTTIAAAAGCSWTAASNASTWLSVTGGATGSGGGTVTFTATANASTQSRTGTLTVAGQTFTVSQAAGACSYALSPTTRSLPSTAGSSSTALTTASQCSWTATASANWISVNASGSGSASIAYSVRGNTSANPRTGTITIGSQLHTITQAGSPPPQNPKRLRIVTGG